MDDIVEMLRDKAQRLSKISPSAAKLSNAAADELERLRKIEAAARMWRDSLESDGWDEHEIESGIGRPGMRELMQAINEKSATADKEQSDAK